jgi:XTP/dITP diphosphohydrolase
MAVPFTSLLVATRNRGKVKEFREIFAAAGVKVTDLSDVEDGFEPAETGRTFLANACLKASAYARRLGTWALADDSGLCVDALAGAPGVYSARFAAMNGAGEGDAANNAWRSLAEPPGSSAASRWRTRRAGSC